MSNITNVDNNLSPDTNQNVSTGVNDPQKELFLELYPQLVTVTATCEEMGVNRSLFYWWMNHDPDFVAQFEKAKVKATENMRRNLQDELYRRSVEGIDKPVYYKGERVDTVKQYSDLLLIVGLKGEFPEKYKDNYQGGTLIQDNRQFNILLASGNESAKQQIERLAAGGLPGFTEIAGKKGGEEQGQAEL